MNVAPQSAEKGELVSRKMTIAKLPVTATTYGGYVNVSRQDIDWTQPSIMDIVINDLAGYYAQVTEDALGDALSAAATAGTDLPATPTGADVGGALWAAAAAVYTATKGQGRLIIAAPPSMLALLGPLFAPVNPQNAQSLGLLRRAASAPARWAPSAASRSSSPTASRPTRCSCSPRQPLRSTRTGSALSGGRAVRARSPGRLRGVLRAAGDRGHGDHQDRQVMAELLDAPEPAGRPRATAQAPATRARAAPAARSRRRPPSPASRAATPTSTRCSMTTTWRSRRLGRHEGGREDRLPQAAGRQPRLMSYTTVEELGAALGKTITAANSSGYQACIDAATQEIDHFVNRTEPIPDGDALANRVCLLRAVEWAKSNDAAFGVVGFSEAGSLMAPRDGFARHGKTLIPLKEKFGVA